MVHLPYRGSAPAMNDLMGKHIEYHVDTVIAIKAADRSRHGSPAGGILRQALAVPSRRATLAELGYPNIDLVSWGTVVVPKGVSAEPFATG